MAVKVGSGVCLGYGATNARRGVCKDGEISEFVSIPTPQRPKEFFGWMARQALTAADAGHRWMVNGLPGPVSKDGELVGPMENVPGLSKQQHAVAQELTAADPAAGRLLEAGFVVVNINDGNLAAHAAASRVGQYRYNKVAALVDGTGTGAGMVERDPNCEDVYRTNDDPLEIGHILLSGDPFDTYERAVSGTALARTYGSDPENMPANHPAWRRVGVSVGQMATTLSVMHGAELVVPTGGVGSEAYDKYGPHLEDMMDTYRIYGNAPQRLFVPDIMRVPAEDAKVFELFGAEGVMRDYMTRAPQG